MNSAIASPEDGALTQSKASRSIALIKHPAILGLILAAATVGLYYPVHGHPFTNYDDNDYVFENRHVQSGLTFANVRWAFTTGYASNWHPLTWISHQLDSQFFGANPYGPHDVNLLLHALNAVLLFWVLWRATGFVGRSFVVAALFALHPINVESVAWIAERKTVLSTMFFLLAPGRLSLVCTPAAIAPLRGSYFLICPWLDVQATDHHLPLRTVAVGLLAAAADVRSNRASLQRHGNNGRDSAAKFSLAHQRKNPALLWLSD